jgi:hypothetical protein
LIGRLGDMLKAPRAGRCGLVASSEYSTVAGLIEWP